MATRLRHWYDVSKCEPRDFEDTFTEEEEEEEEESEDPQEDEIAKEKTAEFRELLKNHKAPQEVKEITEIMKA